MEYFPDLILLRLVHFLFERRLLGLFCLGVGLLNLLCFQFLVEVFVFFPLKQRDMVFRAFLVVNMLEFILTLIRFLRLILTYGLL